MKEVTFGEALELSEINYDSLQYFALVFDPLTGRTAFVAGGPLPNLLDGIEAVKDALLKKQSEGLN